MTGARSMSEEPIPYDVHTRIVDDLHARIDEYIDRYTGLQEQVRSIRNQCYSLLGYMRVFRNESDNLLSKLEIRISELEDVLHAREPD